MNITELLTNLQARHDAANTWAGELTTSSAYQLTTRP